MSNSIYLDHAATTPLRPSVRQRYIELLEEPFGNPSSTHQFGRRARVVVEQSRKTIARELNCQPAELIFTSGGTEADNAALHLALRDMGVKRIITAPTEHHAVLHSAQRLAALGLTELELLRVNERGEPDMDHLEELLQNDSKTLVSLMHGNNEIGNLLDLRTVGELVQQYGGIFHSDTVQTIGHFPIDLSDLPVDMLSASAHKFHGPKGTGFLYIRAGLKAGSFITGGAQERNRRGGTENVPAIGAMAHALELAYQNLPQERAHIADLKQALVQDLKKDFPLVRFNGLSESKDRSLYTLISVCLPELADDSMLLFNLDLKGIAVSGGSACASGSLQGSHVMQGIQPHNTDPVIRFSLGYTNTREDIQRAVAALKDLV